jgi:hypothetical protein
VTATVRGRPGEFALHVFDASGSGGNSALTPDRLDLTLAAGPMAGLAFEGPPALHCGTHHVLPSLRIMAVDDAGNKTTCPSFEVCALTAAACTLLPSQQTSALPFLQPDCPVVCKGKHPGAACANILV